MKQLLQTLTWLLIAVSTLATTQAQDKPRNGASQRYEVNQTFDGTSFFKDNNVWIYTKEFADTFGMPAAGIGAIQGAEAAAFRVEDTGFKLCGMGGKAENCMNNSRYILDVYIDERKTPLPWATDQKADWLGTYNSLAFLTVGEKYPEQRNGAMELPPANALPDSQLRHLISGLRPFMDPTNKREAFWMEEIRRVGDPLVGGPSNQTRIVGYKRNTLSMHTLISFHFSDGSKNAHAALRLLTGSWSSIDKIFHEIRLPNSFMSAVAQAKEQKRLQDQAFYRSLFPPTLGTNPNATPFIIK